VPALVWPSCSGVQIFIPREQAQKRAIAPARGVTRYRGKLSALQV
jgi:hypothetical protein